MNEHLRRFEVAAAPLYEELATIRWAQEYCRRADEVKSAAPWRSRTVQLPTDTTALDARERDVLRRLAHLRTACGLVVH
jgi:hypothetical protein